MRVNLSWSEEIGDVAWFGGIAAAFGVILYVFWILCSIFASVIGFDELRQFAVGLLP